MNESDRAGHLIRRAVDDGVVSKPSEQALLRIPSFRDEVGEALGDVAPGGEILLVSVLVDDSASIDDGAPAVVRGHNRMIDASARRAGQARALFHTRFFSKGVLASYRPVHDAVSLSSENYLPNEGSTPLYQAAVLMLGSVLAQTDELEASGSRVRTFTLIVTDGANNAGESTVNDVAYLVTDMLEFADNHIVAGMGIGSRATFEKTFRAMGIPAGWILTADSSDAEIDQAFSKIERSLELAASSESDFQRLLTSGI